MPRIVLTGQGDTDEHLAADPAPAAAHLITDDIDAQLPERAIRHAIANAKVTVSLIGSRARFRSVIESATDAIVLTGGEGKVISWNPGAKTIFGYSSDEIVGKPISMLFVPAYT